MSVLPISVPTKRLSNAITSAALAFSVNNIKGWDGNNLTAGQFGTLHYVAFRNSTNTLMEIVEIDPTTIASATITITKRGLDFVGGVTTVVANQLAWPANDTLVDFGSDPAQLLTQGFLSLWANQTVNGLVTFITPPVSATNPSAANQVANKAYVDQAATGSALYDQQVIAGTAGETVAAGNVVYFKSADQRWWKADQATASTCVGVQLGFAQGVATAGNAVNVLIAGLEKNQSGLTLGSDYYLGTAAAIASSAGAANEVFVGRAKTASILLVDFRSKALLGNDTSQPVGSSNKLVTQSGLQHAAENYAVSTGSANAYVVTLSPVPTSYTAGMVIRFTSNFGNTGSATVNVNGLGAKTIKKLDGATNLASGDIASGQTITLVYDGTNFILESPTAATPGSKLQNVFTPVTVSSGTTPTDLISVSVPGGTLSTNNAVRIRAYLKIQISNSAIPGMTFALVYGGTTIASIILTSPNSSTFNFNGWMDLILMANNATSAQIGSIAAVLGNIASLVATNTLMWANAAEGTAAVDSTASQTLELLFTSGNASGYSVTLKHATLEIIK